ncbi:unnamed protein product, partial [Phaeothamnion confervicola]
VVTGGEPRAERGRRQRVLPARRLRLHGGVPRRAAANCRRRLHRCNCHGHDRAGADGCSGERGGGGSGKGGGQLYRGGGDAAHAAAAVARARPGGVRCSGDVCGASRRFPRPPPPRRRPQRWRYQRWPRRRRRRRLRRLWRVRWVRRQRRGAPVAAADRVRAPVALHVDGARRRAAVRHDARCLGGRHRRRRRCGSTGGGRRRCGRGGGVPLAAGARDGWAQR